MSKGADAGADQGADEKRKGADTGAVKGADDIGRKVRRKVRMQIAASDNKHAGCSLCHQHFAGLLRGPSRVPCQSRVRAAV